MAKVIVLNTWPDFSVYYNSAFAALHHNNPYRLRGTGYLYPPISLVFFYPLTFMPIVSAGRVWAIFSIVCLLLAIWIILKQYKALNNRLLLSSIGILVFNFFPAKFTLGMGQINNVLLLLIVLAIYLGKRYKNGISGVLFGIALILKYTPIFVIPYLLIRRKWHILLAISLTIELLFILGFLLLTLDTSFYYFQHVIIALGFSSSWSAYYNQALSGFLIRDFSWLTGIQLAITRNVISLIMLAISLYVVLLRKQSKTSFDLEISIFITLTLLLNTISEQHHFVLLLIPMLITYFTIKQNKLKWYYYVLHLLCYLLTAVNMQNPSEFPLILQSHVFYGTLGLWILDLYLLKKFSFKNKIRLPS